jgi:predicted nucleic acid-binding protein
MNDSPFYDTSVLVYMFDSSDSAKYNSAQSLLEKIASGAARGTVSNQTMAELFNVLTAKMDKHMPTATAAEIVHDFVSSTRWQIVNYTAETVKNAAFSCKLLGTPFWDTLIAETMKENNISTIYTENIRDFKKIQGIKVVNPFKQ